ncbi:hypothetical protein [Nocardia nova]|uniref:hypothetical protein n=1 Tax=Nocardia nova TaxID=37330 RepID=UPI0034038B7C
MLDLSPRVDRLLDPGRELLTEAAFGARPDIDLAALPGATDPVGAWLRAVVLGGRGWYAAARAELLGASRRTRDPVSNSLLVSTEASLLRQLGWHARAAALDGRALALALDARSGMSSGAMRGEAICDALTGLAADALGTGQPWVSARLLARCRTEIDRRPGNLRSLVRWHWVRAETGLAAPDIRPDGQPPLAHAEAALAVAAELGSVRHQVKSLLLTAAAAAAAGDIDRSRRLAAEVDAQCAGHGLLPLRWAAAMLRSGVCETAGAARASAQATEFARILAGRGGHLR